MPDPPPMTNQVEGGPPYKRNTSGMLLVPFMFYDTFTLFDYGNLLCIKDKSSGLKCSWLERFHRHTHLSGHNDRLPGLVAPTNRHLLSYEDLGRRDLYPQVAPGNHDAVTHFQDLVKVPDSFFILNLETEWGSSAPGT